MNLPRIRRAYPHHWLAYVLHNALWPLTFRRRGGWLDQFDYEILLPAASRWYWRTGGPWSK